jgi:hypothetical protein
MPAAETEAAETENGPDVIVAGRYRRDLDGQAGSLRCAARQVGKIAAQVEVYHHG